MLGRGIILQDHLRDTTDTGSKKTIKVGICQLDILPVFSENVSNSIREIENVCKKGADAVLLPEIFVIPYGVDFFKKAAITKSDPSLKKFEDISGDFKILLVAGSVVEKEGENYYNTSFVFEDGRCLGSYRKSHLFDIKMKGKLTFSESSVFSPGKNIKVFDTKFGKIGIVICFDLRFPELIKKMALRGAKMIFAPAAFNNVTGPMHWELLIRARALDSQSFLFACSPALNESYSYKAWGHSAIVDPYGRIVEMLDEKHGRIIKEIDLDLVAKARKQLPIIENTKFLT